MFIGHYALAFAAKRTAPRASLGILIGAAQFLDLLWPIFLILGVEQVAPGDRDFTALRFTHYPWSHSLAMAIVWSLVAGCLYAVATHDRWTATVVGLLVGSHWVLDLIVHLPDLPLYPADQRGSGSDSGVRSSARSSSKGSSSSPASPCIRPRPAPATESAATRGGRSWRFSSSYTWPARSGRRHRA
jgi:hypothetical protein